MRAFLRSLFPLLLLVASCGNSTTTPDAATPDSAASVDAITSASADMTRANVPIDMTVVTAPVDMTASGPSPDATDVCSSQQTFFGKAIQQTSVNMPMPTATSGGSIVQGTYFLTASTIYQGGAAPVMDLAYAAIKGSTVDYGEQFGAATGTSQTVRIFAISGKTLTSTIVCGGKGTFTYGLDTTATTFTTYDDTLKTVNVWTKQ